MERLRQGKVEADDSLRTIDRAATRIARIVDAINHLAEVGEHPVKTTELALTDVVGQQLEGRAPTSSGTGSQASAGASSPRARKSASCSMAAHASRCCGRCAGCRRRP